MRTTSPTNPRADPGSSRAIEAELAPIRDALEVAFVVARRDSRDSTAPPPPRALRPILDFAHLPDRALGVVRDALDNDPDFRNRVIEHSDVQALDEGSRLFLDRPEGWVEALAALVDAASPRVRADDLTVRYSAVTEELKTLSESLDRVRSERDRLADSVAGLRRSEADQAERIEVLQQQLAEAGDETADRERARGEAVRQLKAQEALAQRRLLRQRELEAVLVEHEQRDHEQATGTEPAAGQYLDAPDAERVAGSLGRAAAVVDELAGVISELAGLLAPVLGNRHGATSDTHPGDRPTADGARPPGRPVEATRRRRPVRLGRGLRSDSVEGLGALLDLPGTVVMVDGYNVSMKGWPRLGVAQQRESLIAAVATLGARNGATWHLVFDGTHDGARPAVNAPLPVRVHFTPSEVEADDRLLEFVEQSPHDTPVVVVSSDRRVRDGAQHRGANVVSSETLLALLRR